MSFTPEELEERIRVVEAELSWLKQGRAFIGRPTNAPNAPPTGKMTELFPDERHLPNGTRPTLRQSIIIAMRERPMDDWRNDEIIAAHDLDDRAVEALVDLRARGYDLAVVEVSPVPFVQPGESEADRLAYRLWLLHRQELRSRYERLGVAVASWDGETPLDASLEGVRAFRRHARLARA